MSVAAGQTNSLQQTACLPEPQRTEKTPDAEEGEPFSRGTFPQDFVPNEHSMHELW